MTGKVIKCDGETVTIGFDDGSFKIVPYSELGFRADVNDVIDLYVNNDKTVYVKGKPKKEVLTESGDKKLVNKVTYALFAFFLGGFGAHKFYAGKTTMGVIYLVFCWTFVPAVIALIEGIMALGKQTDADGNILV